MGIQVGPKGRIDIGISTGKLVEKKIDPIVWIEVD